MSRIRPEWSTGDHAVLALVTETPRHGWALVRELAPDGEVGRVWTLSRALTYRAITKLADADAIRPTRTEAGDGPRRTVYAATAAGRRATDRWLAEPVVHLRDLRGDLLLKIVLSERRRIDVGPLLAAQRRTLVPILAGLERAARTPDADLVDLWRAESARAVDRFLHAAGSVAASGTGGTAE